MDAEKILYPRRKYSQIMENRAIYSAAKAPFRWMWALLSNMFSWIMSLTRPWLYVAPFGFLWGAIMACDIDSGHSWFASFVSLGGAATLLGGTALAILMVAGFVLNEIFR